MLENALHYSRTLLTNTLIPGDSVIDATVGNGNDTVLLATLVGKNGMVYGFDLQEKAIEKTKEKLLLTGLFNQVMLFNQGHETIGSVLPQDTLIAGAIFNLGYLPNGDKTIITTGNTTLIAVKEILSRLRKGGLLLLVVYHGHNGGKEEKDAVLTYVQTLSQTDYTVLRYDFLNQKNNPPLLIAIEKK
ncbi:putative RNA methylase [Carnobacterium sp. 17-4]|uniref:class I SAM-dependent methyltransferase n=1 Tax=Carnobacterium sp. (strain 17-4) TaxID=208596 RepID=UPI0002059315|nr:class I SAM-dependent methyltransferase [Carnobacterium sp. 17-4]AEB29258.1 putative RNA methylase [Carnobacterium sp. 17-4]